MTYYHVEQRKDLVQTALRRQPFDTVISNVRVVNVYSGEVVPGAIGIRHGQVVTTTAADGAQAIERFDGQGSFALPGFIDAHVHVDSTLLAPESLAELVVPAGTTTLLADPMEIANVAGTRGVEVLLLAAPSLPYHLLPVVPSRVPTAPGLETTGGELGLADVRLALEWPACVGLGELDPSKVLGLRDEYFAKVQAAYALNKIANGHAAGLTGDRLVAYACGGLVDDHESITFEEAMDRLRLGMAVFVREGSTERNLRPLVEGLVSEGIDTQHWMFCTDDKHPDDIRDEGHLNWMVNESTKLGLSPVKAVQMATINAAAHFRLDAVIGSLSPGRWADVVLTDRLEQIEPRCVFFKGKLVAQNGRLLQRVGTAGYPDWIRHTVSLTRGGEAGDFRLAASGHSVTVRVIEICPDQIINREGCAKLPVVEGNVMSDIASDSLKVAVVERYGKNGNIGVSFVRGFGLQRGAIGSSVAHDHHNIIVVGTNERDLAACTRAIEAMQGGLVATVEGEVVGALPLPLAGLLSDGPADHVIQQLEALNCTVREVLGGKLPAPFMSLSFLCLPTVPDLGLTDMGLVQVRDQMLISPLVAG